jgi:hypothetical protein
MGMGRFGALSLVCDHAIISTSCGGVWHRYMSVDGKTPLTAAKTALENKDMKNVVLTLGAMIALSAGAALAQVTVEDTDGNGSYSMEELMVAYPDLTEDLFGEIDADADGAVSPEELTAAQEAGQLPA